MGLRSIIFYVKYMSNRNPLALFSYFSFNKEAAAVSAKYKENEIKMDQLV